MLVKNDDTFNVLKRKLHLFTSILYSSAQIINLPPFDTEKFAPHRNLIYAKTVIFTSLVLSKFSSDVK
jgi:hypothetical protein